MLGVYMRSLLDCIALVQLDAVVNFLCWEMTVFQHCVNLALHNVRKIAFVDINMFIYSDEVFQHLRGGDGSVWVRTGFNSRANS